MTIAKKTEVITVPYQEFVEYVSIIGPVKGVNLRPGKIRSVVVRESPVRTVQVIDITFWGCKKDVNAAKAKLLEYEYNRCSRFM